MKSVVIGIGIYIFGFILVILCSSVFNSGNAEFSYYYAIVFSILYLSAIVGISTSLILKELKRKKITDTHFS
jgi:hypothetical protein